MNEADKSPGYFAVVEPRVWTENQFYRLYVAPEELVGVWAGRASDIARVVAAQGGLIGGLLAGAGAPKRKGGTRAKELTAKPFEELRRDHERNFAIRMAEVESAEIRYPLERRCSSSDRTTKGPFGAEAPSWVGMGRKTQEISARMTVRRTGSCTRTRYRVPMRTTSSDSRRLGKM